MDRVRRLLAASVLALLVTAVCGCGSQDASGYRTYSPAADEPAAEVVATAVASTPADNESPELPSEALPADLDNAAPDGAVDASAADLPIVVPVAADDVTETGAPSDSVDGVTNADGTLLAAVGAPAGTSTPAEPRETKLLIPEKTFRKEGDALRVSYDDLDLLKVLNMEPVTPDAPEHFPQWLKGLDGERIRLRGYMRPGLLARELPFFVLARDTQACCFGPNTKSYDIIPVVMREGVTTDYIHLRPFDIVGTFHIDVAMDLDDPNKVEFLYVIDDAVLIEE